MKYFSFTLLFCLFSFTSLLANNWQAKVHPTVLEATKSGKSTDALVWMKAQADISQAHQIKGKVAKASYVYEILSNEATQTQGNVLEIVEKYQIPYRSYWIVNSVWIKANTAVLKELGALEEVKQIIPDPSVALEDYQMTTQQTNTAKTETAFDWGLEKMNVPAVWNIGIQGEGVVVGGQDTGYKWDHEAVKANYRGWDANDTIVDHNYNWHDAIHELNELHADEEGNLGENPCGLSLKEPCDDNNHGTHTIGTIAGGVAVDADINIGVAPKAKWIGCRNMERGWGKTSTYIECFQWFLAPTDVNNENPDPSKAPHVINNSWSCPEEEGCVPENFETMETVVNNLVAAGTVVVASASNGGRNGCGTINSPANIFEASFTVGASNNNDDIANFSSRGPVIIDGSFRQKPNVVAPGVQVYSATADTINSYARYSGTSMAGPNTAGVVALMIDANPLLEGEVYEIQRLLQDNAVPIYSEDSCGTDIPTDLPNNLAGWGRINAEAAVVAALQYTGTADNDLEEQIIAYPNPVVQNLHFICKGIQGEFELRVYDIKGQLVGTKSVINGDYNHFSIYMGHLSSGMYFYELSDGAQVFNGKIVRE